VLIDGFHRDGQDVFVSEGFEDGFGIRAVGFVSGDVGSDSVGREQDDVVAHSIQGASPVMGATAGLEENGCGQMLGEESFEFRARETVTLGDLTRVI